MRAALTMMVHERRTQVRSLRFRLLAALHLLACCVLPVAVAWNFRDIEGVPTATVAVALHGLLAPLSALLAAGLSFDAISRERDERSYEVLSLAPLTSFGYLARRWLALQSVLLPMSLLPVLLAALASFACLDMPLQPGFFFAPWLLKVVPITAAVSALALGLGTITGGFVSASIALGLLLVGLYGLGNDLLARRDHHLAVPLTWIVRDTPFSEEYWEPLEAGGRGLKFPQAVLSPRGLAATAATHDTRTAARFAWQRGLPLVLLGFAALGLSCAFMRRTKPDLRPWAIRSDHPLRTYLAMVNRSRESIAPDRRLALWDHLAILLGLVAGVLLVLVPLLRAQELRQVILRPTDENPPAPMAIALQPRSFTVQGTLGRDGALDSQVALRIANEGGVAEEHLAFTLNEHVSIDSITADRGSLSWRRDHERLVVTLDQALAPGEALTLQASLSGRPGSLVGQRLRPLAWRERTAVDLRDTSLMPFRTDISSRRLRLDAEDLGPVPRYSSWELVVDPTRDRAPKQAAPEVVHPIVDIELELDLPEGLFVADSCGQSFESKASSTRYRGGCVQALNALRLAGARLVALQSIPALRSIAVHPAHQGLAELHLPAFEEAARRTRKAWPGRDPFSELVILEWPPEHHGDPRVDMAFLPGRLGTEDLLSLRGKLCLVNEPLWTSRQSIDAAPLGAAVLAADLSGRRPAVVAEQVALDGLVRAIARGRLGLGRRKATLNSDWLARPLTERGYRAHWVAKVKAPRLVTYLSHWLGEPALVAGLESFLSAENGAGTCKELFEAIGRAAGRDLSRFHEDFVSGGELPHLSLAQVSVERDGRRWVVKGMIENQWAGEVSCPVTLMTEGDGLNHDVLVSGQGLHPFELTASNKPTRIELDPMERCYRYLHGRAKGQSVDFSEDEK